MSAPEGNSFWKMRSTHGRKPIFPNPETLWDACCEYFDWVEANPLKEAQAFAYQGAVQLQELPKMRAMTLAGLFIFLDIDRATWENYRGREDFFAVTSRVDEIIRTQKFEGAAAGLLNANIIARDLGLADKQDIKAEMTRRAEDLTDDELAAHIALRGHGARTPPETTG